MRQSSLDRLEANYEAFMEYLNSLYDEMPTNLVHIPQSRDEIVYESYWEALGEVTSSAGK